MNSKKTLFLVALMGAILACTFTSPPVDQVATDVASTLLANQNATEPVKELPAATADQEQPPPSPTATETEPPPPPQPQISIMALGIAGSNDHVYVWFSDGTVSSGTSGDLNQYRASYGYSLAPGKTPDDIVGMGIAGSNDHVYVWYRDGTVSSGTSDDLDQYRALYNYSTE